jgi:Holliday junction DNA helicase RuvB
VTILRRSAGLLGVDADEDGHREIAGRSRGTPRIANRLLRRVRDWAQVHGEGHVDLAAAQAPWRSSTSTPSASTGSTGPCSRRCAAAFGGGPVGLSTLAVAVGEEADTVETVAEPYLVREGLHRAHAASPRAWTHLGITPPRSAPLQDLLPVDGDPDDTAAGRFGG